MVQSLRGRGKASHAAPLPKERAAGARAVEIPGSRAGTFRRIGFRVLFAFVLTRLVIVPESSRFMRAHFQKGLCTLARTHTRTHAQADAASSKASQLLSVLCPVATWLSVNSI